MGALDERHFKRDIYMQSSPSYEQGNAFQITLSEL
jgi:hypothetical protein